MGEFYLSQRETQKFVEMVNKYFELASPDKHADALVRLCNLEC